VRSKLTTLLKVVISLGLIVWVFSRVNLAEVGVQLSSARPLLFGAALAMYLGAIAINAWKWRILLGAQQVQIPFWALLEFQFTGFFFNNFLPNIGGDVMRGYGLARYTERTPEAAVSVVVDRIIGFMAYMVTAVLAALISINLTGQQGLQQVEWVAASALAVLMIGLAVLLSRRLRGLMGKLFHLRWLHPLAPAWDKVSEAFNCYRFHYRALVEAFGVGLLGIVCTTFVNWFLSQAMGGGMPLLSILLFNPLIGLVLMIPISIGGGLGVSQNVYPFFYGLVGVPAGHAVAVSVLMQLVTILGSLPGGAFWWRSRRRVAASQAARV
jgi:glycosyltransferase 2 family protein